MNAPAVSAARRREVIDALRRGTVPQAGLDLFAVGLELAMLFTPYPATFGIRVTETFVVVTLSAHLVFGVTMGLTSIRLEKGLAKC